MFMAISVRSHALEARTVDSQSHDATARLPRRGAVSEPTRACTAGFGCVAPELPVAEMTVSWGRPVSRRGWTRALGTTR